MLLLAFFYAFVVFYLKNKYFSLLFFKPCNSFFLFIYTNLILVSPFKILLVCERLPGNLMYNFSNKTSFVWEKRYCRVSDIRDYQIPVIQLKGPKGNGEMQAVKRD